MVGGAPDRPAFALVDHFGRPRSESDFRGRFVIVYFGFTSCRVVCPRALTKLSQVIGDLGGESAGIDALYISVDPDRDTPEVMRAYLEAGYPRFLGLTGSTEAIAEARRAFRVFAARKADPADPDGYDVAHTAISFLLDREGRYADHFPDTMDAGRIVDRIRLHRADAQPPARSAG